MQKRPHAAWCHWLASLAFLALCALSHAADAPASIRVVNGKLYDLRVSPRWLTLTGEVRGVFTNGLLLQTFHIENVYGPAGSGNDLQRLGAYRGKNILSATVIGKKRVYEKNLLIRNCANQSQTDQTLACRAMWVTNDTRGATPIEIWDCGRPATPEEIEAGKAELEAQAKAVAEARAKQKFSRDAEIKAKIIAFQKEQDASAAVPNRAGEASPSPGRVTLYDANPQHLWNRLHEALFIRLGPDARSYGEDRLEPLLWPGSKHLLAGPAHERAVRLLQEFIENQGEKLVQAPLKRALLQRDLWLVFTWLQGNHLRSGDSGLPEEQLREALPRLQSILAAVISRLALSPKELKDLRDNYAVAVASGAFAKTYAGEQLDRPYLPPDLFAPAGPWVCVGRSDSPVAPEHLRDENPFRNSAFLIFLRLPGGRDATLQYLSQLGRQPSGNDLPDGSEVALVRRAMLLSSPADVTPTPLTESIQVRVYHQAGQSFYEYRLNRHSLLNGRAGGLRAVGSDERDFKTGFAGAAWDPFEDIASGQSFAATQMPIKRQCIACHALPGGLRAQHPPASLLEMSPENAMDLATKWRRERPDWSALQRLLTQ